jgi:GTP-binding protein EngB required for normal cell division
MTEDIRPAGTLQDVSKSILDHIDRVRTFLNTTSLDRHIEACRGLLRHTPLIDVAILGQFKAGKSSFINSLIGRQLLPVGVIPVTTVITRIRYGPRERAVVLHYDGSTEEIPLESIEEYTSESKNPGNEKDVDLVDIELSSLDGYAGLRLVDTPGLGSVFKYHVETSKNWLPEVGAALLAISADRPLSDNDLALIRELMQYTPRIVLLLTKADLLSAEQQEEVLGFFADTLKRELDKEFPIYLYSTRVNAELFKRRIVEELLSKLSANRDREFGNILTYKVKSLGKTTRAYLEIAYRTSLQADADRERIHAQILGEKSNLSQIQEDLIVITRAQAVHTRTSIDKYLERFRGPLNEKLTARLREDMQGWKGNLWKFTRQYEQWLYEHLVSEIDHISATEHTHFFGTLFKAQASLERYVNSFRALLEANIERVLGVKMAAAEWKIDVDEPARPHISIGRILDFHFDLIWFLIPMFLFRGLFERHFLNQLPNLIVINFSRLAAQWEMQINRAIEDIRARAMAYIRDEIATIDALLSQTGNKTETIKNLTDRLEAELARLN